MKVERWEAVTLAAAVVVGLGLGVVMGIAATLGGSLGPVGLALVEMAAIGVPAGVAVLTFRLAGRWCRRWAWGRPDEGGRGRLSLVLSAAFLALAAARLLYGNGLLR